MNKSKFIIVKITLILILSACSEDFVDIKPKSVDTAETFLDSAQDVELAVIGLYSALQSNDIYGQNYAYFTEHYSDNAIVKDAGRAGRRYAEFVEFNVSSNNLVLNPFWNGCYRAIQRANVILNRVDAIEMDEVTKKKRIGEVKFIRAMLYFDMVRIWGGVPLVLEEVESPVSQFNIGRENIDVVYTQIINDLINANNSGLPNSDSTGRVSGAAVRALLGKVYLTRQEWSMAINVLSSIVNDNEHELLANFSNVFSIANQNNSETLFEIQYINLDGEGSNFHRLFGPVIGDYAASADLLNAFIDDPRLQLSYYAAGFFSYSLKYADNVPANQSSRNLILIRYADVLLMLSEALNEQSYNSENAFLHLNAIRTRAGLSSLNTSDLPDQATFREEVRKQRRLELAHENTRWFDLVRWGIAIDRILEAKEINIQEHQLLFPIPFEAIAVNQSLSQNPGYF